MAAHHLDSSLAGLANVDAVEAANGQSFAIAASVAFAVILWEYVTLLPDELRLYRKPVWRSIPPYAYLALRYGGILATLPVIFLSAAPSRSCQAAASLSQTGGVLVVASSTIIFTFRTFLLWSEDGRVGGLLGGLSIVTAACWITLATKYRTVVGPTPAFGSDCRILPTVSWLPLGNASFTIFLVIALILTLFKMGFYCRRDSLVAHLIYRANFSYLVGTTATAITALIIQSVAPPSSALVLSTGSISATLTVALGTRAFRNLMLAIVLANDRAHTLPHASTSDIMSHASEMRFTPTQPARPPPAFVSRPQISPRPPTTGPIRPRAVTMDSRPPPVAEAEAELGRPTNSSTGTYLDPTSLSPTPNSFTNESLLSGSSPRNSPSSISPLRRGGVRSGSVRSGSVRSGWSDA
ncbi:hypothetical protein DFH06DRAFT_751993 [Mycena polygramma]|nr:hypothetical protein DFH06DRAFT_751993 [Mycena polygramma]